MKANKRTEEAKIIRKLRSLISEIDRVEEEWVALMWTAAMKENYRAPQAPAHEKRRTRKR
jgi:uncharacterized protein (UPF0335 family)